MLNPTAFTITDDSGFLAIVNADKFNSFVSEQWELLQLFQRFIQEMNKDHLIIWATGLENKWTVHFLDKPTNKKAFREFSKAIEVTDGQLFLTNYEDLTMAAQFVDEKIPSKQNQDLYIQLDNGKYEITVRQLFDPTNYEYEEEEKVNFEIVIQPDIKREVHRLDKVFWWRQ
jgi:hypothetical protein